jgi:hypothetical protein
VNIFHHIHICTNDTALKGQLRDSGILCNGILMEEYILIYIYRDKEKFFDIILNKKRKPYI